MSSITETMVRKWAGKLFDRNEFKPSAKMCADYFGISKEDAAEILNRVYSKHSERFMVAQTK